VTGASSRLVAAALASAALGAVPAPTRSDDLTPQERAGRRIYFDGESPSGAEIWGLVGAEGTRVPASAVSAGCHGDDGLGRPEGAVVPSEVTWTKLTKPYGITHPDGRRHPLYDEATLARSIADGLDPAGNALDWAMPRYSMPAQDLKALVAFMKKLENHFDPGVSLAAVRLGVLVPGKGRLADVGQALLGILDAWCRDLNATGGIHGRKLVLEVTEYDSDARDGLEAAKRLVAGRGVVALLSGFLPEGEQALGELAEADRLPVVGLLSPFTVPASGQYVFHVLPGVREPARALAAHAVGELGLKNQPAAVLFAGEEPLADAARAAKAQLERGGWRKVELVAFPRGAFDPAVVDRLRQRGTRAVLFLGGDGDLAAFTRRADASGWAPQLLVPGVLVSRALYEVPAAFQGRLFVAYPTAPTDEKPAARDRLAKLRASARLDERHRAAQVSAYAAASVLSEGLRRTGRNLSRDRLARSIESLSGFETGLTPKVGFAPGRHVGAMGAHLLAVDLETRSLRPLGWRAVE